MKYAGIGSRETPSKILDLIGTFAADAARRGWILRTGGAPGADQAFANGAATVAPHLVKLYLPNSEFEIQHWRNRGFKLRQYPTQAALEMAKLYHPNWKAVERYGKRVQLLMARNSHQVLGWELDDPADLVVCWTKNGMAGGGTGQAIRIARAHSIPVCDLGRMDYAPEKLCAHALKKFG